MRTLLIASGNRLRGDDGVAHRVAALLPDVPCLSVMQLTPELAAGIAEFQRVVFLDADVTAGSLRLEPLDPAAGPPALTHVLRPMEIVALSRALFGFSGDAFVYRIPAEDLSVKEGLSPRATELAAEAADLLRAVCYPSG